ncbi:MAG: A24 family peptidase [Faecalibacterium sp.]|nr:A24 family peptidase [Ruminococcus sp.]MCM1391221.1 A24 family peptidase [Ruminococcus sp.]MCM1486635.1 A24 family peptidase [Faecalibacterium sp.]
MSKAVLTRTPQYEKKSKFNKACIAVSAGISFLFILKFGFTFELLKATLILAVFLFSSVCDIKERKVEDYVPIMLLLIGLINISPTILFNRAMTFAISFALMFVIAVISNNKIGGADVKFIAANTFVLGMSRGVLGLIIGLILSVVGTAIRNKRTKTNDKTLPLIPYLSAGYLIVYLVENAVCI